MKILLATHNPHKRSELQEVLTEELGSSRVQGTSIEVLSLDDVTPAVGDIPETSDTLEGNALIKARTVHSITGLPTIADDTGLQVTALGGAPGVYSARYAGDNATNDDNVNKLLEALEGIDDRSAHFATVIAYIDAAGKEHLFRGEVRGIIALKKRGIAGFGYDPIFVPIEDPMYRTFAEMTAAEKHHVSHRARALREFCNYLKQKNGLD